MSPHTIVLTIAALAAASCAMRNEGVDIATLSEQKDEDSSTSNGGPELAKDKASAKTDAEAHAEVEAETKDTEEAAEASTAETETQAHADVDAKAHVEAEGVAAAAAAETDTQAHAEMEATAQVESEGVAAAAEVAMTVEDEAIAEADAEAKPNEEAARAVAESETQGHAGAKAHVDAEAAAAAAEAASADAGANAKPTAEAVMNANEGAAEAAVSSDAAPTCRDCKEIDRTCQASPDVVDSMIRNVVVRDDDGAWMNEDELRSRVNQLDEHCKTSCNHQCGADYEDDLTTIGLENETVAVICKSVFATSPRLGTNVLMQMGFGPEVEFHGLVLGPKDIIPEAGEVAKTSELSKGTTYPVLAMHIDHQGGPPFLPIVEAVFGPVEGTKKGIQWLNHAIQQIHEVIKILEKPTPFPDVITQMSSGIFNSASALQAATITAPWTAVKWEPAGKTYTQINMQVALDKVVEVWKASSRLDSRIVGYAAVEVAKKLVAPDPENFGTLNCAAFHGFLSQFLVYIFFKDVEYVKMTKNLPGVLVKASLQELLIGTMLRPRSTTWLGGKKVTIPNGPVDANDLKRWVATHEGQLENIVDSMFEKIGELLTAPRTNLPVVFDEQVTISWARGITASRLGEADAGAPEKWMWRAEGIVQLKEMVTKNKETAKTRVMDRIRGTWMNVFVREQGCNSLGQSTNQVSDSLAGATVSPFFLHQTGKLCVLSETRSDSGDRKDLPMVMIDEPDEFLSLLLYFAGA